MRKHNSTVILISQLCDSTRNGHWWLIPWNLFTNTCWHTDKLRERERQEKNWYRCKRSEELFTKKCVQKSNWILSIWCSDIMESIRRVKECFSSITNLYDLIYHSCPYHNYVCWNPHINRKRKEALFQFILSPCTVYARFIRGYLNMFTILCQNSLCVSYLSFGIYKYISL